MKKTTFYSLVLAQVVFLVGMILINQSVLWWGKDIILETRPIDPHSLFRGEYVDLHYQISELALNQISHPGFSGDSELRSYYKRGSKVFVQLEKRGQVWQAAAVSRERKDMQGRLYLTGRVEYAWEGWGSGVMQEAPRLGIRYGLESYYTPEGQAIKYERDSSQPLRVKVAVDPWGRGKIKALLTDLR